jgi:ADP-ribosyl-[dinitrogen reductase] hydrolase
MAGGDTDTNAAIAGALLGAVHGRDAVPSRWRAAVLTCRASGDYTAPKRRPEVYWPIDTLDLAERLLVLSNVVSGRTRRV